MLGKAESGTFVLDFFNEPDDILSAFQPYYKTAELRDVSDPNLIHDLFQKLRAVGIFTWSEVEQFAEAFFVKSKSPAAIANICKPAVERWKVRYIEAVRNYKSSKEVFEAAKKSKQDVLIANAETQFKDAKKAKDVLDVFKKDLGTYVRFYEFMSQIVDYDDKDLEKLSIYARNLSPLLRETYEDDEIVDLTNVEMTRYRLSKIRQRSLDLNEDEAEYGLKGGEALGTAKPKDKKEEQLSQIIEALNELFITDELTDDDLLNYAHTVRDKLRENAIVMNQIANNTDEQAMLGDFPKALDDAILDSSDAHENQKLQLLSDPEKAKGFARLMFELQKMVG
jgi:type I restriction enzyme R subunit